MKTPGPSLLSRALLRAGLVLPVVPALVLALASTAFAEPSHRPRWSPALHRAGPALEEAPRRKAPKSLTYIYGEQEKEEDAGEGGDDGSNPGGDGTGDAATGDSPDPGGVLGFDITQDDIHTRTSDFNGENLEDPGFPDKRAKAPGNLALCICEDQPLPGYATAPGYGNDWDQRVRWFRKTPQPGQPTLVRLRFVYNHDTEPGRDFLSVDLNRGGEFDELFAISGSNRDQDGTFGLPAIFDQTFTVFPGDYVGAGQDEIELRLRVTSDPAGSDEDGNWPTSGAAQIDEIRVWFNDNLVSHAPFDVPPFDDGWIPVAAPFAGDFLKLQKLTTDLDPCRENVTFQFSFVDDGTPPNNAPGQSTGGSVSPQWSYGPGGFVVNYTGGVSDGSVPLNNELRTPVFAWDAPGAEDDAKYGSILFFSVWKHLPLDNGLFYRWSVRSRNAGGWSAWRDHGFTYYEPSLPHYERVEIDCSTLMVDSPESVQVALGVVDLAEAFGLAGDDATPSPMFDNIAFAKYPLAGPAIHTRTVDLFQDGFPTSGSASWQDPASLAIRLDMARDIHVGGSANVPGDSLVADVRAVIPGTQLAQVPQLKWVLRPNSRFNDERTAPPGAVGRTALSGKCDTPDVIGVLVGLVNGAVATTPAGAPVTHRWWFDLPDGPASPQATHQTNEPSFFFPGDEIHWFLEAKDDLGTSITDPPDTTGFFDFRDCSPYSRAHRVRGLPTLLDPDPAGPETAPTLLVIDDTGQVARQEVAAGALSQIDRAAGIDYDLYAVRGAGSGVSNGIGSAQAHGATAAQLGLYERILYLAGDQGEFLLNNGAGFGLNDKSEDLAALINWRTQNGPRHIVAFGDNLVSGLVGQSAGGAAWVQSAMAVQLLDADLRDDVDNQVAPFVEPTGVGPAANFLQTTFVVGACLSTDQFDAIAPRPIPTATISHGFLTPAGVANQYAVAAGVWHDRIGANGARVDVTFPFALSAVLDPVAKAPVGRPARALLLEEVFDAIGAAAGGGVTGGTTVKRRPLLEPNFPNPFNPSTSVRFALPQSSHVQLRIYDALGRRVATLLDEERPAGAQSVRWLGVDDRGAAVASGVYLLELRVDGERLRRKMALVR